MSNEDNAVLMAPAYVEEGADVELVIPVVYTYDVSKVQTMEDVREFIKEQKLQIVTLPWITLEMRGLNPNLWVRCGTLKLDDSGKGVVVPDPVVEVVDAVTTPV